MVRSKEVSIIGIKIDFILKAINSLSMRTNVFEDFVAKTRVVEAVQPMPPTSTLGTSLPIKAGTQIPRLQRSH